MIELRSINFNYNKKNILSNFSCEIKEGSCLGVLGHNGAGKTTLFRIIMGLIKPTSGEIIYNNDISKNGFKGISFLPENNGIYETLTAYENLEFRGRISSIDKENIKISSNRLLKSFKLYARANERVYIWSNGMKKRLALAAAMITEPEILILDEPTNGIDPESLDILIRIIKDLKKFGTTIIISSHNLEFVSKICTEIIIIQEGNKIYESEINKIGKGLDELYLEYTSEMEREI